MVTLTTIVLMVISAVLGVILLLLGRAPHNP
jgi:hypothetical protein